MPQVSKSAASFSGYSLDRRTSSIEKVLGRQRERSISKMGIGDQALA